MFITTVGGGMIGSALLGGLLGGSSGANSATQTSQQQIDPRLSPYLYGSNGSGGLIGNVSNLYQQQNGQGGLNPMQTAGLEMQRKAFMDPRYTQGFDQMRQLGGGLMGQGVAGNPFTGAQTAQAPMPQAAAPDGRMTIPQQPQRSQALGFANQPITQQTAAPQATAQQPQMSQDQMQSLLDQLFKLRPPSNQSFSEGA